GLRAAELALQRVDDPLLLRREAHLVRREPRLVALGRDDALGAERRQQEREDALVGAAGADPELLPGHPGLERVRAMEGGELVDHGPGQAREALRMNEPVAIDADHAAGRLQTFEQGAQALRAERYAPRQGRQADSTGPDVTDVLFEHGVRASCLQELEV